MFLSDLRTTSAMSRTCTFSSTPASLDAVGDHDGAERAATAATSAPLSMISCVRLRLTRGPSLPATCDRRPPQQKPCCLRRGSSTMSPLGHGRQDLARGIVDAVPAAEVAAVVVGHALVHLVIELDLAVAEQLGDDLAVVKHFVALPPNCGYSFLMVWKQCGHEVMTLRTLASFIASTLACACSWKIIS